MSVLGFCCEILPFGLPWFLAFLRAGMQSGAIHLLLLLSCTCTYSILMSNWVIDQVPFKFLYQNWIIWAIFSPFWIQLIVLPMCQIVEFTTMDLLPSLLQFYLTKLSLLAFFNYFLGSNDKIFSPIIFGNLKTTISGKFL